MLKRQLSLLLGQFLSIETAQVVTPTDRIKDMIRQRIEQIPSSEYALLVHFEKDSHITPSLRRIQGMLQDLIQSDRDTTEFVDGN